MYRDKCICVAIHIYIYVHIYRDMYMSTISGELVRLWGPIQNPLTLRPWSRKQARRLRPEFFAVNIRIVVHIFVMNMNFFTWVHVILKSNIIITSYLPTDPCVHPASVTTTTLGPVTTSFCRMVLLPTEGCKSTP